MTNNSPSSDKLDARGIPSNECISCGSTLFTIQAAFDEDYNINSYLLNCECAICGTLLTAPTPLDHIEYDPTDVRWL